MKEQILKILRERTNGLRKREIAMYLHCHHFTFITMLFEMEEDGLIFSKYVRIPENMEFYDEYYITGEGLKYLELIEKRA